MIVIVLLILVVCLLVSGKNYNKRKFNRGLFLIAFLFFILVIVNKAITIKKMSFPVNKKKNGLYRYIYVDTKKDAIFLIPESLDDFRLGAGRAIVVDFKSYPFSDSLSLRWYERILRVRGFYKGRNCHSLEEIKNNFSFDYFVMFNQHGGFDDCADLVYQDDYWQLFLVRDE